MQAGLNSSYLKTFPLQFIPYRVNSTRNALAVGTHVPSWHTMIAKLCISQKEVGEDNCPYAWREEECLLHSYRHYPDRLLTNRSISDRFSVNSFLARDCARQNYRILSRRAGVQVDSRRRHHNARCYMTSTSRNHKSWSLAAVVGKNLGSISSVTCFSLLHYALHAWQ